MEKLEIRSFTRINKSKSVSSRLFQINLKKYYPDLIELALMNKDQDNFLISFDYVKEFEKEFKKSTKKSISRRESNLEDYLTKGYIVSEINSSLKAEGINSTQRQVETVIKNIQKVDKYNYKDIDLLIFNYYEAIKFILKQPKINENNIFTLFNILTLNIEEEVIGENSFYRDSEVFIGKDKGFDYSRISTSIKELVNFINSDIAINIHTKAIISHYIFENIHPYLDFNGRMGRLLHLWILINDSFEKFWEIVYLSESIYSFKAEFGNIFTKISKAKKSNANIDLNYFVASFYILLIKHNEAYIKMKDIVSLIPKTTPRNFRLFLLNMICSDFELNKWYTLKEYKIQFSGYSTSAYTKVLQSIQNSNIFDIKSGNPIKFRIKREFV